MGGFGQAFSTPHGPIGDPGHHLACADAGIAEQLHRSAGIADEGIFAFHAFKTNRFFHAFPKLLGNAPDAEEFWTGDG